MKYLRALLSVSQENNFSHLGLLVLRLVIGLLMMRHGFSKMENYSEYAPKFYDFLGLGTSFSLSVVIFAEFFCSIFLVVGLFTRFVSIPLLITMLVAVFIIHADDEIGDKEVAIIYLGAYITLLLKGGGKFSVDYFISK
jgi:putative oxidoreductase